MPKTKPRDVTEAVGNEPLPPPRQRRIDDAWRRNMAEMMERYGVTAAELGRIIGCSKASVGDALSLTKRKPTWLFVDAAEEALRRVASDPESAPLPPLPAPIVHGTRDTKIQLLHAIINSMSDDKIDAWIEAMTAPPHPHRR